MLPHRTHGHDPIPAVSQRYGKVPVALASTICLTMANWSKGAAGEPVNPRHRHHVAGLDMVEHLR